MASVTVRNIKNRGWVVDISTWEDGARKRSIKTFGRGARAREAAERYRDERAGEIKTGKFWERRTTTFRMLWEKFEAQELVPGALRPATIADYQASARLYLLPHFGDLSINELERDIECVKAFKAKLLTEPGIKAAGKQGSGKPLSARTVAKILTLLGSVFHYGEDIGLVSRNPVAKVKKPRAAIRPILILEPDQIQRLLAALDDPQERLLVELDLMTGLRSGELRGVTWSSIDLKGKRLFVVSQATRRRADDRTKTDSSMRMVPIASHLIPRLERWKLECPPTPEGFVFPGKPDAEGKRAPLGADYLLRNILRRALRRAGLPDLRFQDIRHLACTLMAESGVPIKRAQEVMGHANILTTLKIYTHVMNRRHHGAADKMAELAGLVDAGNTRETASVLESKDTPPYIGY